MRRADARDLPAVEGITRRAYEPYLPILGHPPMPLVTDYAERIAAGEVWVDTEGAKVGALAVIEEHDDHIHIFSLAVDPGAQHRGAGRRLLAFAEERARTLGRDRLTLLTNAKMERNIGIYLRAGYVETQRAPHPTYAGSVAVHMEKRLPNSPIERSA